MTSTAELDFDNFTLTSDQQKALDAFNAFLLDPTEQVFVLRGFSGCGKSTLVRTAIDRLPAIMRTLKLINPSARPYEIKLTATTNKAAENLAMITGLEVGTIHSFLGLRVSTNYKTNTTELVPRSNFTLPERLVVFIDEASYIDSPLLALVFKRTKDCKIVFVGDPAQLTPVKSRGTPVFEAGFTGAALTEVVRQPKKEGGFAEIHPITAWAEQLRNTVTSGDWTPFKPDGFHIQRLDRAAFNAAIEEEFTRSDWRYSDSKILGWTNKCVIAYNQYVRNLAKGDPHFQVGDYAVNNSFVQLGKQGLKTDELVQIALIENDTEHHGVAGNFITVNGVLRSFVPKSLAEKKAAIKYARDNDQLDVVQEMEDRWFDLRGAYASTINKAQGSTYDKVFIDLDDIDKCHDGEQVARMLYVGASRARHHVYLTGDLTAKS
jgi:ATP-dependent exoDNAse (exonuclease V) alpha subunit